MKNIIKKVAAPTLKKLTSAVLIVMISIGFLGNPVLAVSDTVKYTYDESGNRIMKEENGKKTYYVNKYYEEDSDGTTRKFVYANGVKVSTITTNPDKSVSTVYHHQDHLGGSNVSTDSAGKVAEVNDYYPYGGSRIEERNSGYTNDKLYTGKELDRSTGLYYYGARYYDPLIGRFTSVDPWGGDVNDPQSLNKYSYTLNNPLKYTDPTGTVPDPTDALVLACGPGAPLCIIAKEAIEALAIIAVGAYISNDIKDSVTSTPALTQSQSTSQSQSLTGSEAKTDEKKEDEYITLYRGDVSGKQGFVAKGLQGASMKKIYTEVTGFAGNLDEQIKAHTKSSEGSMFVSASSKISTATIYAKGEDGKQLGSIYTLKINKARAIPVSNKKGEYLIPLMVTRYEIIDEKPVSTPSDNTN